MSTTAPEAADHQDPVVVVGAGPAGLTAAYQLVQAGRKPVVAEADDVVGGISRTVVRDGWRFDIGGHRFFTKVAPVEQLWHQILPDDDFLLRPRMSRIFYKGKYYDYPLKPLNALKNLGLWESFLCGLSYLWARLRPPKDQTNYEGWLVARFGWRLYRTFFKTYTEKVWGVPVAEMPADWAAQRVKSLDLGKAVVNALTPKRNQKAITSLIEEFQYPKYGPGMMWERCRDQVEAGGGTVLMETAVSAIHVDGGRATAVTLTRADGSTVRQPASHVISSMPMNALVKALDPPPPEEVRQAGADLHYRDYLTVALVVPEAKGFPDNWIYIHAPDVKVGRIQNYGRWSPHMVKEGRTCLGLEYFVFEGDDLWASPDEDLIERGTRELAHLGLVDPGDVEAGYVVRVSKAYPYYDLDYKANVAVITKYLDTEAPNVHPVGRNGMHKYNNQDHSMYTAMLTVDNILGGHHDIWAVNVEEEYHEQSGGREGGTGRDAPVLPRRASAG
ncbi:MAG TPA: NAD(P)/FAD-dependent oxidoreductase [Acidimicrobiales bacterium]|nr:NAD(P)/FAD-dependent oxidoreductase [Acidimicrobiales bacterium]